MRTNTPARLITAIMLNFALTIYPLKVKAEDKMPVKIGWIGPLTGNSAVVGVDSVKAVQMVLQDLNAQGGVNGHPLQLFIEDDRYETAKSLSSYSKLVHVDKVKIIFMSTYGAVFAVAKRALQDNVLIFDTLDCNDDIASLPANIFCLATRTESIAENFVQNLKHTRPGSVLILHEEEDPWMGFIQRAVQHKMSEESGIPIYSEGIQKTVSDFRPWLVRAKAKKVDAIVLLGNDQMGLAMAQAKTLDLKVQFYTIGSIMSPGFQKLANGAAEGAIVSFWRTPQSEAYQAFLKSFNTTYGHSPLLELAAIPAYDAARILTAALPSSYSDQGDLSITKLQHNIYQIRNYQGLSGLISFDSDGAVRTISERLYRFSQNTLIEYD
jgi:branched-chain amino acid transport system substrate-binding protein